MTSTLYKNEIIKRGFFEYLRNAKRFSDKTIDCYEKAIWQWEDFSNKANLSNFNKTEAEKFKNWLKNKKKAKSQERISLSYCYDILRYLRVFFDWLSKQKGYKKKIDSLAIDYLHLTREETQIATQPREVETPTLEEIKTLIENIKGKSEVDIRDKALLSLFSLTGARISAVRTLSMKCFNREKLILYQDPKLKVETKHSKRIVSPLISCFYKESLTYFLEWFDYLEKQRNFKSDAPIFPMSKIENGEENLSYYNTGQVEPVFWKNSSSLRNIIKKRFEQAGIRYYHPHTFRHWFIKKIMELPLTEVQQKAISQSVGHEDIRTTFGSYGYGKIDENRQVEIIRGIDFEGQSKETKLSLNEETIEQLAEKIKRKMKE